MSIDLLVFLGVVIVLTYFGEKAIVIVSCCVSHDHDRSS